MKSFIEIFENKVFKDLKELKETITEEIIFTLQYFKK
jgi:hypothetical protein